MTAAKAFNFDPLESLDELKSSGIDEKQARALIKLVKNSSTASFESLATKDDLALLESRMENKLDHEISMLAQKISGLMGEMKWVRILVGSTFVAVVANIIVSIFLHHP